MSIGRSKKFSSAAAGVFSAVSDAILPPVRGLDLDPQTRCRHWHEARDVVAIKMLCCGDYWACIDCHRELADHAARTRPADDATPAVLCGACGHEMTARQYLDCGDACPRCGHGFNPGCRLHRHLYFAVPASP